MKKHIKLIAIFILTNTLSFSAPSFGIDKIKKYNWGDLEVVWIEDSRLPTYSIDIFFADGSLSDGKIKGVTQKAFDYLDLGTRRFSQKDIAENLEFFGTSYSSKVTHEYSVFQVSGLVKDLAPTMKQICHLFQDATYHRKEIAKNIQLEKNALKNLVSNHSNLASRVAREVSLKGTPYSSPVNGKLVDLKRISQKSLRKKMDYFNNKVKKIIYMSGPAQLKNLENIFKTDCGWTGVGAKFVRSAPKKVKRTIPKYDVYFVPVPKANQAKVRYAGIIEKGQLSDESIDLASGLLGGGFTSKLMRELRVKRGLTYGVGSFAGMQRDYGRVGISTSTKNKSVLELIQVVKDTINKVSLDDYSKEDFDLAKGQIVKGYPFLFEKNDYYLFHLMSLSHRDIDYSFLTSYAKNVEGLKKENVSKVVGELFDVKKLFLVVVGNKSILKDLKKYGKVKVLNYKNFL